MIKKILGLFLITISSIICISEGVWCNYTFKVGTEYTSPYDSTIKFQVLNGGNFKSIKDGVSQSFLSPASYSNSSIEKSYFWWNNKKLYFNYYYKRNSYEDSKAGIFNTYYECEEITQNNIYTGQANGEITLNNCQQDTITDFNVFGNFLSTIQDGDYRGLTNINNSTLCFSSHSLEKSLCFYNSGYDSIDMATNINFSDFPTNILGMAPGGNTQGNRNNNNYYCPTIGQLLNNYGNNYNTGLCYNSTLYYNNQTNQFETIEKKDIFTVFSGFDEFKDRVSIYYNNCKTPATQQYCADAFSGEFEKYSIISNATNNNVIIKDLWNYCNMSLNYDPNWSTCVASGYIAEPPTEEEFLEMITNGEITKISTPGTGNILNNLLEDGETRENLSTRDILGQLNQIKEKLGNIFQERSGKNGIIPDYIMWLILTTLLLTVLLKK